MLKLYSYSFCYIAHPRQPYTENLPTLCYTQEKEIEFSNVNTFSYFRGPEIYRESPDPSFPVRDTESDPRWGWLGLACETTPTHTHSLAIASQAHITKITKT